MQQSFDIASIIIKIIQQKHCVILTLLHM